MRAYQLTLAAAAAGLLIAVGGPATAATLSTAASAPLGIDHFNGAIEPVHYRKRAVRRYYSPYYRTGPVISFGYSPYPYSYGYAAPYYRPYPYAYGYPYGYGYGPTFSFGFGFR